MFGIQLTPIAEVLDKHYELQKRDWEAGGGAYDIVMSSPVWNAEFMQGYYLQLDPYLDKFNYWDDYKGISENFRKIYCEWGGHVYAYCIDGDATNMYYRKDILSDPSNQSKFKAQFGYDLPVPPKTWDQLYDVGKFFTGWDWGGIGKTCYGLAFTPWDVTSITSTAIPMYGNMSQGKMLFDEKMEPLINSEAGLKALDYMKKFLTDCMMPGYLSLTWDQVFGSFISGQVAVIIQYGDIGRLILNEGTFAGSGGMKYKGKIGYDLWPAPTENGKHYCSVMGGRICAVSKFSKNPEAAVRAMLLMNDNEHAINYISDVLSGEEPMRNDYFDLTKTKWDINIEQEWLNILPKVHANGYPDHIIPGSKEYYDAFAIEVTNFLTGKYDAATALKNTETNFNKITERYGRDSQIAAWKGALANLRSLGYPV
jgi:multiple sugar transport system substrate-binding protein